MLHKNVLLVLPTRNPGVLFDSWLDALNKSNDHPDRVMIIDSSSQDGTQEKAKAAGFEVAVIDQVDFNHGSTRQLAVNKSSNYEYIVFMTQDAILSDPEAFGNLLKPFDDNSVAAVCGRQLPHLNANHIEAHARLFNYPEKSSVKTFDDRRTMAIKVAFLSNSYAAYRISALNEVGGFPDNVIFGEDMFVAARLLKTGYKVAYAADARVYHSHAYSILQEFKRYFDMGVFHSREPWIRQELGDAEGEGLKFVISEFKYLLKHAFWIVPESVLRLFFRYMGFRLGLLERWLPNQFKSILSMNAPYFR